MESTVCHERFYMLVIFVLYRYTQTDGSISPFRKLTDVAENPLLWQHPHTSVSFKSPALHFQVCTGDLPPLFSSPLSSSSLLVLSSCFAWPQPAAYALELLAKLKKGRLLYQTLAQKF